MASKPGNYDLSIYKGMTLDLTFTWKDSAGVAINLATYTAKMQIRDNSGALLDEFLDAAEITLGGAAGTIRLLIPATVTGAYTFTRARYDLELTDHIDIPDVVTRLLEGQVIAHPQVTV